MLFVSKKHLVPTNANRAPDVYLHAFFKSSCKLVRFSRMEFPWSCSCQDDCGIYYACAVLGWNLA